MPGQLILLHELQISANLIQHTFHLFTSEYMECNRRLPKRLCSVISKTDTTAKLLLNTEKLLGKILMVIRNGELCLIT